MPRHGRAAILGRMQRQTTKIAIAGAGSVGFYAGACLARAGCGIRLLARPDLCELAGRYGIATRDLSGPELVLPPHRVAATSDPRAALDNADLVIVTVKSKDTAAVAKLIAVFAPPGVRVLSLQNGVANMDALRENLAPGQTAIAGMVPFNVVQARHEAHAPLFTRATSGTVLIDARHAGLAGIINVPGLPVRAHADMPAVLWGKLVINLNNAVNALAGVPLREELSNRRWRHLLSDQIREALNILSAHHIAAARIEGLSPALIARALRLPNGLFRLAAARMLAISPDARSSMWDDLDRRRPTEIGYLQGEIVTLANSAGRAAPISRRIMALVRAAEAAGAGSPRLTPEDVREASTERR